MAARALLGDPVGRTMADLIRTLEADLFGAHEWAADFYGDLRDVPEAPDRLAVYRGLMRAYEALEGKADDAMKAAEGLVATEDELDDREREALAPLDKPRDALFNDVTPAAARAFVAAFEEAWTRGPKQALLTDALLAALASSNVIASLGKKTLDAKETASLHARAAELYDEAGAFFAYRVATGSIEWRETAQSAVFRASVAWRLAGDEQRAKGAAERAGPPPDAASLQGRGLRNR